MSRATPIAAAVFCLLLQLPGVASAARQRNVVTVSARPIMIDDTSPDRKRAGALRYLGGLVLTSRDRLFGGLSSLRWNAGALYALSDQDGAWFTMTPIETGDRLVGIAKARRTRLRGPDGAPLTGKRESDAESMNLVAKPCNYAQCPVTGVSVGLERDDRILTYKLRHGLPVGRPRRLRGIDSWLRRQPDNLGIESMAGDAASTLMISEGLLTASGDASALLFRPGLNGRSHPVRPPIEIGVPAPGEARPSELVQIDGRHFILLRRSWSKEAGFAVDVERLTLTETPNGPRASTALLARFVPPLVTDNYEGAALRREGDRTFLYLVSDDNFDPSQRTLLLKFEICGGT